MLTGVKRYIPVLNHLFEDEKLHGCLTYNVILIVGKRTGYTTERSNIHP